MDWKSRAVSAADAVSAVRNGTNIALPGAWTTPAPLLQALCRHRDLESVRIHHLHPSGPVRAA